MRERLLAHDPEVLCLTEADSSFMQGEGHTISATPDYGYPIKGNRRKVLLWSRKPWKQVDQIGDRDLPPGRFVAGLTETSEGPIFCVGVCIPWAAAHVSTGRKDRKRWEDHLLYLEGLKRYLEKREEPFLIMGDFNQAIPRRTAPAYVYKALEQAVLDNVIVFTAGETEGCGHAIDHIGGSRDVACRKVIGLPAVGTGGTKLSDHFGLMAEIELRGSK